MPQNPPPPPPVPPRDIADDDTQLMNRGVPTDTVPNWERLQAAPPSLEAPPTQGWYAGPPPPQHGKPQRNRRRILAYCLLGVVATFAVFSVIGALSGHRTTTRTITKVVTRTTGPVRIVKEKVRVPGPTVYKTRYEPASGGPAGTTIARFSGRGSQVTGSFTVPSSGNYVVKWRYGSNDDCSLGSCQGSNFSVQDTNTSGEQGNLPNDIAGSGSGSTEDTGMSGQQSFNVQAMGWWTITVISA